MNQFDEFTNINYKQISSILKNLSPLEFTSIGCLIGLIISVPLTSDELNSLGNFFELVGQVMLTYQAQMETLSDRNAKQTDIYNLKNEFDAKYSYLINLLKNKHN